MSHETLLWHTLSMSYSYWQVWCAVYKNTHESGRSLVRVPVDRWFESRSGKSKDNTNGICCLLSPSFICKFAHLALNNNHSPTHCKSWYVLAFHRQRKWHKYFDEKTILKYNRNVSLNIVYTEVNIQWTKRWK
jgi:predicted cupin superfamily sugar epimerase